MASKAIEFAEKTQKELLRHSGSFNVIDVRISRKPVCYFTLLINSNLHPVSCRFGVILGYCSHLSIFCVNEPTFGSLETTYPEHIGVIGKRVADSSYSASALLAMQRAVLATGIPFVRMSVRLSATFRYCVQTNEDTVVRFSASGWTIPLVSGEVKFIRIFAGDNPRRGR